jgi:regulator of cell morphogenesis and NO signaling
VNAPTPTTTQKAPIHLDFVDPATAPLVQVVRYVLDRFHVFERAELNRLPGAFRKVTKEHGVAHPELVAAQRTLDELVAELHGHFDKEEQILLPYIESLDPSRGRGSFQVPFGNVEGPVQIMQMEHVSALEAIARIKEVTNDLAIPSDASPAYRALFESLRIFMDDVHEHIAYEDVLFPRAIEVEAGGGS